MNVGDYTKDVPSIQALLDRTGKSIPEILSGDQSLGAMFENEGHKSIPSSRQPTPGRADFLHFESKLNLFLYLTLLDLTYNLKPQTRDGPFCQALLSLDSKGFAISVVKALWYRGYARTS